MTFARKLLAASVFAAATTGSAFAADTPGAYFHIGGGSSKINGDCAGTTACDTTGTATRIVAGWRLGNAIALEAVALDFGKATVTAPVAGMSVAGELKSKGIGAGVALYGDFGPNWAGSMRLGGISMKGTTNFRSGTLSGSESKTSTQTYVGFGLGYRFTEMVMLEGAIDASRSKFVGDDEFTVRAFTLNLGLRF
jgi:OmpA-OmpF porin, OOP family